MKITEVAHYGAITSLAIRDVLRAVTVRATQAAAKVLFRARAIVAIQATKVETIMADTGTDIATMASHISRTAAAARRLTPTRARIKRFIMEVR